LTLPLCSLGNPHYLTEAAKRLTRVYHMYTNSSTFVYYQADKPLSTGASPQPPERDMDAAHFFSHLSGKKQSPRLYYSRSLPEGDLAPLTDDIDTSWMPTMPPLPPLTRPEFNGDALTQVRRRTWIHSEFTDPSPFFVSTDHQTPSSQTGVDGIRWDEHAYALRHL
jgi:hypothetical protein